MSQEDLDMMIESIKLHPEAWSKEDNLGELKATIEKGDEAIESAIKRGICRMIEDATTICEHCKFEITDTYPDYCPECGMLVSERFVEMEKTARLIDVAITEFTLIARGKETNQENWDDFWEHAPQEGDKFWEGYGLHRYLLLEDQYGEVLAEKYLAEEMALLDIKEPTAPKDL